MAFISQPFDVGISVESIQFYGSTYMQLSREYDEKLLKYFKEADGASRGAEHLAQNTE